MAEMGVDCFVICHRGYRLQTAVTELAVETKSSGLTFSDLWVERSAVGRGLDCAEENHW